MAEINLEAEQVVGEEEESAPKGGRGGSKKGIMIFGGIVVVEAIVLFLAFSMFGGSSPSDAAAAGVDGEKKAEENSEMSEEQFKKFVADHQIMEIPPVSITVGETKDPRGDRRITVPIELVFTKDSHMAITTIDEETGSAWRLIKGSVAASIRTYLFSRGIHELKESEAQQKLAEKLLRAVLEDHPVLTRKMVDIRVGNVTFGRQ